MKWYDANGHDLRVGDRVMHDPLGPGQKFIGYLEVASNGALVIHETHRFSPKTLRFEQVDNKGVDEGYQRTLAQNKPRLYWWWHQRRIPDVVLLERRRPARRGGSPVVVFDAPVPWA